MNKKIDVSDLINLTQAAKYLKVSYMTIFRWKKTGKLKAVYIGGFPYIPLGELVKIKEGGKDGKTTKGNS